MNQRDHRKLLIVDGRTAFLGGINISSVYSGGSSRRASQASARTASSPGATPICRSRVRWWRSSRSSSLRPGSAQKGEPLAPRNFFPPLQAQGKEVVRAIGSSPDDPFSLIYVTLLSAIGSAETEVCLTNAYFVPDPQLLAALKAAAARGVDVQADPARPAPTRRWCFTPGASYYDRAAARPG